MKWCRWYWASLIGGLAVAAGLTGGLVSFSHVSAQTPTVSIGSLSLGIGQEGTVSLRALDVGEPGLGAWTIDVVYEPEVVSATDCDAEHGGICNEAYRNNTVRVNGIDVYGLTGDVALATLDFSCKAAGETELSVVLTVLADSTLGGPQPIDAVALDGSVTCAAEPEPTARPTAGPKPSPTPTEQKLPGDVNCDDEVGSVDAALVLQYDAGLAGDLDCAKNGDLNDDGDINAIDAAIILQEVAGLL